MRRWSPGIVLLASAACGDPVGPPGADVEPSTGWELDGAVRMDAAPLPRRQDARVQDADAPAVLPAQEGQACVGELVPPGPDRCERDDVSEPSDRGRPALLRSEPGCGVVEARAADKDRDAYRFRVEHSDPVKLELSYRGEESAELSLDLRDDSGRSLARGGARDGRELEQEALIVRLAGPASYDARVEGEKLGSCVPYALRVTTRWCSDGYEDNDSATSAAMLTFEDGHSTEIQASGSHHEADFYEFIAPRAEPILVTGEYEADVSSDLQIRRVIGSRSGLSAVDVAGARTGTRELWRHWLLNTKADERFLVQVLPTGEGCAHYRLRVETRACSDAREDDDDEASAKPLSPGEQVEGSAYAGDDDFYALGGFADGATCTLRYERAEASAQALRVDVYSASHGVLTSVTGSRGSEQLTFGWTGPATVLDVRATVAGECQPYSLRCE